MKYLTFLLAAFLLGCHGNKKNSLRFFEDYENARGWIILNLESGIAFSGKYAQKITPENEYSHGFFLALGEIAKQPLKKIKARVKITAQQIEPGVQLVIDVYSPLQNKSIAYNAGKDWGPEIKNSRTWISCTNEMEIPATATGSDLVKVYIWNAKRQKFFIDDFEVIFEK
jgi:hypothetical protein